MRDFDYIKKIIESLEVKYGNDLEDRNICGTIQCIKCGGVLHFTFSNHHVLGVCKTENCLKWFLNGR